MFFLPASHREVESSFNDYAENKCHSCNATVQRYSIDVIGLQPGTEQGFNTGIYETL